MHACTHGSSPTTYTYGTRTNSTSWLEDGIRTRTQQSDTHARHPSAARRRPVLPPPPRCDDGHKHEQHRGGGADERAHRHPASPPPPASPPRSAPRSPPSAGFFSRRASILAPTAAAGRPAAAASICAGILDVNRLLHRQHRPVLRRRGLRLDVAVLDVEVAMMARRQIMLLLLPLLRLAGRGGWP